MKATSNSKVSRSKAKSPPTNQPTLQALCDAQTKYPKDSDRQKLLNECVARYLVSGKSYLRTIQM